MFLKLNFTKCLSYKKINKRYKKILEVLQANKCGEHWNGVLSGFGWFFCEGFFIAYNMQISLYISKILLEQILEIFFFFFPGTGIISHWSKSR